MNSIKVGGVELTRAPWKVRTLEGWTSSPGFTVPSVERTRHGAITGRGRAAGRTVTVTGTYTSGSHGDHEAARDALVGLFRDGGTLPLVVTHGGEERSADVQLIDQVVFEYVHEQRATWELSLYAPDPWQYGPEQVTFTRPIDAGVGLVYPLFAPSGVLSYGSALEQDAAITNRGNAAAYPTFMVVGDFPGGFRLTVDRRSVEWPWPTVREAPVQIESTGSVWIGSANVTAQASLREWPSVRPGGSAVPVLSALQGGEGWCETHHRDTYI